MAQAWSLVGRATQLRGISSALRTSRGALLIGDAGVGKTSLARTAAHDAPRSTAVRWVTATASCRALPLGAFAEFVEPGGTDPLQMVRHIAGSLASGDGTGRVLLVIDDAHLLDDQSAFVVHQLAAQGLASLIVVARAGEPLPEAVEVLWRDGLIDRIEVPALTMADTGAVLDTVLGDLVADDTVRRLFHLSGGNSLYLRHLVEDERAAGRLARHDDVWLWRGTPAVSSGLRDLVAARIGDLAEPVRTAADVLALCDPIGLADLTGLVDLGTVEVAEERGLVRAETDAAGRQVVRLAHPLYGEVLRAGMGELRARRLRGQIAEAMDATDDRSSMVRAVLSLDADVALDPLELERAAATAMRMLDLPLASGLARAALEAGGGFGAHMLLGNALSWLDDGVAADVQMRAAQDTASDPVEKVRAAFQRVANLFYTLRRPDDARHVLDAARAGVPEGIPPVLDSLDAAILVHLGEPKRAVDVAASALAAPFLPDPAVVLASFGLVGGLGLLGRADEIGDSADRAYAAGAESSDAAVPCFGLAYFHLIALRLAGYVSGAAALAETRSRIGADIPGPAMFYAEVLRGHAARAVGDLPTSIRCFDEARAALGDTDTSGFAAHGSLGLADALALVGRVQDAQAALVEADRRWPPACAFLEPERLLVRARVASAEGSTTEAVALAVEAADLAASRHEHGYEVAALHAAVCLGDTSVVDRLLRRANDVQGPRAPATAAHAAALAAHDGDGLQDASVRLEEIGDRVAAVDAAAQASVAFARQGLADRSRRCASRAMRLSGACGGVRTPALAELTQPVPLTGREREIVLLAARGLTNQQIADRLTCSVRTVEGHLYRAGAKLGTRRRSELAEALAIDVR
ncbi:LuxR C-terminal-related transcriptional regulator [Cellulomonas sp. URHE0023]|uniref:helix-turn-helix transcriptional regulator n=1 Tax=Cellulomonas sp. URHE0023 TaxID=1380354 RepID=UPI000A789CCF|nr:LuxR C-terminal-related transcriptional regulator [Cellulomonas sp. URHE0023]